MKRLPPVAITLLSVALPLVTATSALAVPKVILISLDGAVPSVVNQYLESGVLSPNSGLGLLNARGIAAQKNVTITPSVTAASHIAIATGSSAASNDIIANSFHLVASEFSRNVSGFGAPIGGYSVQGPTVSPTPTAEPLWVTLRAAGKRVVTATWPGGDGVDVIEPTSGALIQPASVRTVDYTVPFGAFGGVGATGFTLTGADFGPAPSSTTNQLAAAGKTSFSPVRQKTTPLESFTVDEISYTIQVAALDTTDDSTANYDTLVFFDTAQGIQPGPFALPSTGPAYVRASDQTSGRFYLEGSPDKDGTAFYVSTLAPDLATVRLTRYSVNHIPRNTPVLTSVDDINNNVGFWAPQPDFRIVERISPGFTDFPDTELEAIYQDLVRTFVDYQTRVGLRAISQNADADLAMIYIEQPDGSGHQFTLTDARQPTTFTDPTSIGAGQDPAKITRYAGYLQTAYQVASNAVQRVIDAVGTNSQGVPNSNIFVVSDHGMAPFHTAVSINTLLLNSGFDSTKVRAVTTGPAANIYINLQGREAGGTVSPSEYITLQKQVISTLAGFVDPNPNYNYSLEGRKAVFDLIVPRPTRGDEPVGTATNPVIGQDSGDVFAILKQGYNFDGTQFPVVQRLGDPVSTAPVLSLSNFYGAHGYESQQPLMSAIFYAAGPNIRAGVDFVQVRNIDVAPTILRLLNVEPATTVQGKPLNRALK